MAKIVYTDHDKAAPYVSFHGVAFTHGQEVEVDDENVELLEKARENPFFEVTEFAPIAHWDDEDEPSSPPAQRGAKARKPVRPASDEEPAE